MIISISRTVRRAGLTVGLLSVVVSRLPSQQLLTRAERSSYTETSRYADVVAFLDSLARRAPSIVVQTIGTTVEGREIPMVIASRPHVTNIREADALRRPIVYLNASIHPGEVEGKEAVLALLRDLVADSAPNVLDSVIVVAVPVYNADGTERVASQAVNRTEQHGPELVGTRANAQGFDLNRDYIKAEAPETDAFLRAWRTMPPDVYVDLHTTNGSYHGYALTYAPALTPNADPYARDVMLPSIRRRMRERHGFETFDYGNFDNEDETKSLTDTIKPGWFSFDSRPRFGFTYAGLRGAVGILSEAYSHDPFERRVRVTRAFVQEILSYTAAHAEAIMKRTSSRGMRSPLGDSVSIRGVLTPTPFVAPVIVEDLVATGDSAVTETGVPRGIRRTGRFRTLDLPIYDRFISTLNRAMPAAYLLPAKSRAAVTVLVKHGIDPERVTKREKILVESFVVDSTWLAPTMFQGHRQRGIAGHWVRDSVIANAGDHLVRLDRPAAVLAVYLLEPESDDGLVTWNVFDAAIKRRRPFPVRRVVGGLPASTP